MNDSMGKYVASEVVKLMIRKSIPVKGAKVLMLGITFKENCPDIRNTKAIDIYNELVQYGINVDVYDPWAKPAEVKHEYGINNITNTLPNIKFDAIVLAVAHNSFNTLEISSLIKGNGIIYDVKTFLNYKNIDGRL
jgi:UDP-N-acetyl-D-galactosamine dehydrogenase